MEDRRSREALHRAQWTARNEATSWSVRTFTGWDAVGIPTEVLTNFAKVARLFHVLADDAAPASLRQEVANRVLGYWRPFAGRNPHARVGASVRRELLGALPAVGFMALRTAGANGAWRRFAYLLDEELLRLQGRERYGPFAKAEAVRDDLPAPWKSPDDRLDARRLLEQLENDLTPEERLILSDDLPQHERAELLGISYEAFRQRKSRLVQRLLARYGHLWRDT